MNKAILLSATIVFTAVRLTPAVAQERPQGFFHYRNAKASGANLKKWWVLETTIGGALTGPVSYSEKLTVSPGENHSFKATDTVLSGTNTARPGAHINISASHQLLRISTGSMISFSTGIDAAVIQSSFGTTYAGTREVRTRSLYGAQVGIPLALEYKLGCDVDFDPYVPVCFAVGGGAIPAVTYALHGVTSDVNLRVAPYAYASVGFYAGGCWKLRASYTPGNVPLMQAAGKNHDEAVSRLTVGAQNVMTLGVTRMLGSKDWRSARAWRGSRNGGSVTTRMF